MRKFLVPVVGGLLATLVIAGSASASTASGEQDPSPGKLREARADFVECLREQGVDVPEPGDRRFHRSGEDGDVPDPGERWFRHRLSDEDGDVPGPGEPRVRIHLPDDPDLRAAVEKCGKEHGDVLFDERRFTLPVIPEERLEELRGNLEAFHACLREQGVDVPELPDLSEAPDDVVFRHFPFGEMDDAERAAFREAAETCGAAVTHHLD